MVRVFRFMAFSGQNYFGVAGVGVGVAGGT